MQNLLNHGRTPALDELYDYAQNCGIGVFDFHLPESRAVTLADSQGQCVIGIDNSRRYSHAELKTMLAHELGHCATGTVCCVNDGLRSRYEVKAENWAIVNALPYESIIDAYKQGARNESELAEYLEVSETFVRRAIAYYLEEGKGIGT